MLFNSLDFSLFLPIVFVLYWFVFRKNRTIQNAFIVCASYFFYGCWDWRFLSLILFSTVLDFLVGVKLSQTRAASKRKQLLVLSIVVNLGFLMIFKYFNFFIDSFVDAFKFAGVELKATSLEIVLPVGISFYTFQTMSYTIDVYKEKLQPTKDFISFAAFVSFFPQLVAGPIERATNLLPQFHKDRFFDYKNAILGLRQILWGLCKKVIVADGCAVFVNEIFDNYQNEHSIILLIGAVLFALQIYGDFSGYSDIAIGVSRLFGFSLMQNFAFPYFSRDVGEFWRRWHISLSTWFRDYLYIPLGGSKGGIYIRLRNVLVIFLVSGFWHGANWTFIAWGALHALYFVPLMLLGLNRNNLQIIAETSFWPSIKEFVLMIFTFLMVCFAWIFFRAESIAHANGYILNMLMGLSQNIGAILLVSFWKPYLQILAVIAVFIVIEWYGRKNIFAIASFPKFMIRPLRWAFYVAVTIGLFALNGPSQEFIYFQF